MCQFYALLGLYECSSTLREIHSAYSPVYLLHAMEYPPKDEYTTIICYQHFLPPSLLSSGKTFYLLFMAALWNRAGHYIFCHVVSFFFVVTLWNRADHYIFVLWFLLLSMYLLFSSPNLSHRRLDVCHTSTHGVALVQI